MRAGSLVLELAARTAIVDGTRFELPPAEFDLLAVFAARPGEVIPHKELATVAFGAGAAFPPQELHRQIWKLKKALNDQSRDHKLIRNRRGQGYMLDLPASAVNVVGGSDASTQDRVIRLEPTEAFDGAAEPPLTGVDLPQPQKLRLGVIAVSVLIAALALGASWLAGYEISSHWSSSDDSPLAQTNSSGRSQRDQDTTHRPHERRNDPGGHRRNNAKGPHTASGSTGFTHSGGTGTIIVSAPQETRDSEHERPHRDRAKRVEDPAPPVPPQPDAPLYHLFKADTGDHIMTTSSSVANQKQAAGYDSSVEGGVFTAQQQGTAGIAIDGGTVYVYRTSSAVPNGVAAAPLYRLRSSDDFFYTSSSAAANQAQANGWARSTAGYIAT